jgi:uncharacterized membrane protein
MSDLPREAEAFLRDLERHLSPLPEAERRDTVAEIRSHLVDRAAQGAGDLLGPFGAPEAYAAAFLDERALSAAMAHGTSWAIGRALLRGARRVWWWYTVAALGLVQVLGASFLVMAVLKLFLPGRIGLFVGPRVFVLGSYTGDSPATELLGWWGIPFFFVLGVVALWSGHWMLRLLAGWRLARIRPALHG